ncbi:MAG: hypothetical protein JJT89_17430 [Nitriliruptoraceae bacterium]|nr:hypothetical protein [Nitriliruptoraceae bacterium]
MASSAAFVLAACGPDEPDPPEEPDDEDLPDPDLDEEPSEPSGDDATEDDDADEGTDDEADDDASEDEGAAPLDVEETTDISERDAVEARLMVTDVRVGSHDGFDRIVVELEGEGEVGWSLEPTDSPTSQGRGDPVEFEGASALWLSVRGITLPGDEPEGIDPDARFETDTVPGTGEGPVIEVVRDTIFEGIETYAIGLDEERAYRIARFEDPERVVIDVVD